MCAKTFAALLLCLLLASEAFALGEAGQPGGYLRAGVGARALALGNAYVSVDDEADAVFWNPAGLGLLKQGSFASSVSSLSLNRQASDAELAWPFGLSGHGAGTWALGWTHFSLGNDFEGRSSDTASFYTFGDDQNTYVLSHGRAITPWLMLGLSGKLYEHRIDTFNAYGGGLDIGLLLIPMPGFRLGVTGSDLLSSMQWDTGYVERFPFSLRVGLSAELFKSYLLLCGQVTEVQGRDLAYEAGLEFRVAKLLAARIGIQELGFTVGGGISVPLFKTRLSFDYAYAPDPLGLGDIQKFSLGLDF